MYNYINVQLTIFCLKNTTKRMFLYVIILLCQIIYVPYIVIVLYTLY